MLGSAAGSCMGAVPSVSLKLMEGKGAEHLDKKLKKTNPRVRNSTEAAQRVMCTCLEIRVKEVLFNWRYCIGAEASHSLQ